MWYYQLVNGAWNAPYCDIKNDDGVITLFTTHTDHFKAKQTLVDAFGEMGVHDVAHRFPINEITLKKIRRQCGSRVHV
ncbi:MAG: hypothetical protein L3J28_05105 [Candidatus Polarisedimenticolaceae bacterium]|nr:hypothetical protein [Candidatus Polarisedimenticolaceae bacterium]